MLNLWPITFFIFQGVKDHMKKNLRIVSAAAALLAVAPVAASAVSVNAADSTATTTANASKAVTTVDLEIGRASCRERV